MTACTNHGGKARRVVTAALVGVLSVGAVPMAAVAEGVNDAISPMFAEPGTEFSDGEARPTFTIDSNNDGSFGNSGAADVVTPDENAEGVWGVTTSSLPVVVSVDQLRIPGAPADMTINASNIHDYKIRVYRADENGDPTGGALAGNKVVAVGDYVVVVTALAGDYEGQTFKTGFYVKGQPLPTALTAFENGNTLDTSKFIYTGSPINLGFKYTDASGQEQVLEEGVDYTVVFKDAAGREVEPTNAGTYTAVLTGLGVYEGSTATVKGIQIKTFTLDDPNVHIDVADFVGEAPSHPSRVWYDGDVLSDGSVAITELDPSLVGLVPTTDVNASGIDYTFDVTVDASLIASGNITLRSTGTTANGVTTLPSTEQVTARKVDHLATFQYNGQEIGDVVEIDASAGYGFNRSNVYGFVGSTNVGRATLVSAQRVEDAPGVRYNSNDEVNLNAGRAGLYKVTYEIPDGTLGSESYSGYKTFFVKIYKGTVDVDKSLYVYAPEDATSTTPVAISSYEKSYDGSELYASSFGLGVKGITFAKGDLDVAILDAEGNPVDFAVNAGSYKFVVTSDWYKLSGTTELPITINKVDLTSLEIGKIVKWNDVAGEEYLPLEFTQVDNDGDGKVDGYAWSSYPVNYVNSAITNLGLKTDKGDGTMVELPDNVEIAVEINDNGTWKEVGSIEDPGQYRLTVSVAEGVASNYVLPEGETSVTLDFTVAYRGLFKDVQPSAWYYNVIQKAFTEGYMNGTTAPHFTDAGKFVTGVFTPEGTLTRGQVACVLFNASGADMDETGGAYNEHTGWVTGFDDVDGTQFYGEAIYWAKQNGVINGYADGTFQADKPVTREEFVSMLANYAKVVLGDSTVGTVSTDVLADYPDGSSVAGWAAENVAWAASKGIAGNGGTLMPADTMTRAYCAAMMVNYLNPTA